MSFSILSLFGWLLNKKAARAQVSTLLAFFHWVGIALHPWPSVSDNYSHTVLKGDVKLQLTNFNVTHQGAGRDTASIHFRLSITRTDIGVLKQKLW